MRSVRSCRSVPSSSVDANQSIRAIPANAELAALLGVPRRSPLLEVARQALDPDGVPLEWSYDTYRADAFSITVHSRVALPRAGIALTLVDGSVSA
jgi:hypothetical protein